MTSRLSTRVEWGFSGLLAVLPWANVVVIVDVLSFSTAVEIACARGARVWPAATREEGAQIALAERAELAARRGHGWSLSPASLQSVSRDLALVLPSPNGGALSMLCDATPTLAGCLRNRKAIAARSSSLGPHIAVIAAGERWPDTSLRPAFEDWIGAGAILDAIEGEHSPESMAAIGSFRSVRGNLLSGLLTSASGAELSKSGFADDVRLAAELDISSTVPQLSRGHYHATA